MRLETLLKKVMTTPTPPPQLDSVMCRIMEKIMEEKRLQYQMKQKEQLIYTLFKEYHKK